MAILTEQERRWVRNRVEVIANQRNVPITWLKSQINAGIQAIEDRWEAPGTQTALSNDIEAAAPGVFTAAEKKYLAAFWLIQKGRREEKNI